MSRRNGKKNELVKGMLKILNSQQSEQSRINYVRKLNPGRFRKAVALSSVMGDTFLDYKKDAPVIQFFRILSLLRSHGYEIVEVGK